MQSHVPSRDHTQADIAKSLIAHCVQSREKTKGEMCFSLRSNSIELFACDTSIFVISTECIYTHVFDLCRHIHSFFCFDYVTYVLVFVSQAVSSDNFKSEHLLGLSLVCYTNAKRTTKRSCFHVILIQLM